MAKIIEQNSWDEDVYSLEVDDPVVGGNPEFVGSDPVTGFANAATQQLANRTLYLKFETEEAKELALAAIDAVTGGQWPVYPTEAAGRAAVSDGDYFQVVGAGDIALYVYRRDSASASTLVASYPSSQFTLSLANKIAEMTLPEGPYNYREVILDKYGNIVWGVRTSDGRIVQEDARQGEEVGDPLLDGELALAQIDPYGNVITGLTKDGEFVADPEWKGREIGIPMLHATLIMAVVDENYNVIYGINRDGTTVGMGGGSDTPTLDLYVKLEDGKQKVKLFTDKEISIGSAFESYAPVEKPARIEYKEEATVSTYKRFKDYPFSEFPVNATAITHVIGFGESLAAGTGSSPVLITPLIPSRVFMMNAGVLSLGREQDASAKNIVINDSGLQFCVPAFSQIKESPVLAAAYQYAVDNPTEIIVVSQHGIGGAVIADMVRGNFAYDNLVHTASQVKCVAETNGATYKIAPISYVQGTNDWATPLNTYRDMLDTLWTQLNEDLKSVSRQTDDIVIVIEQTLSGGGQNDGSLGFAQIEHALANPTRFRCSNPRYGLPYVDNAHLTGPGYVNLGASQGFGFREDYVPLYPVSAVRSGTTVTLTYNEGGLTLDTTTITNTPDGNYGFFWKDDSNSAVITNVTLLDNVVTITLDQIPTGANPQIRVADRRDPDFISPENVTGTGKRCCLRTASLGNDSLGSPVYKRAAIFRINVI